MQQAQREIILRRELMYRQTEARATDRSSPKRARDKKGEEPRQQEATTTQSTGETGNPGVQAERCREGQDLNDKGYETLTFTNNTGTRYSHWLRTPHAHRIRAHDSANITDSSIRQKNVCGAISLCRRWYELALSNNYITNSEGWDPEPPPWGPRLPISLRMQKTQPQ